MKATISQDLLARGLQIVSRAVAGGATHPAFTHIHLQIAGGHLQLTATDTRTAIRYTLPVQSHDGDDQCLLPARLFSEFVGAVPTGTLTLTTDPAHPDTVALTGGIIAWQLDSQAGAFVLHFDGADAPCQCLTGFRRRHGI